MAAPISGATQKSQSWEIAQSPTNSACPVDRARIYGGVGDRDRDEVNQGQPQADGDGREAHRHTAMRRAKNDEQEKGGHDDLGDESRRQRVAPRRMFAVTIGGKTAKLEIGLVGGGDIEAMLVRNDGRGFEGLDVELLDASGRPVATARSDYDGFILFERVAYGSYSLRLTADSAKIAGVERAIGKIIQIGSDHSVARLGPIRLVKAPSIALAEPGGGAPASR